MVDWSDDRIAALSKQDLKNLLANAERKSAAEIVARCKAEMEKRDTSKPRKASKPRTELKEFEHAHVGATRRNRQGDGREIRSVGGDRESKIGGREGLQGAQAAGLKGYAKLGGMQRDGSVAVDRYISYRRGKDIVSIGVFLLKDQPVEAHEFHVIAPLALLDGGKPIAEIRPTATEAQKQTADSGLAFTDLASAAAAFEAALAKIAA